MATRTKKKTSRKKAPALPGSIVGELNGLPVRRVQAGALTGASYNPRTITKEALKGLGKSTERFGLVQPIVWNKRTQRVVGGHQRLKTLDPNSVTDVVEVDLSDEDEVALNLALNNPHTAGEFTSSLADLIAGLEVSVPDLAKDLRLDSLYVDVPAEVDELLDNVTDKDKVDESEAEWDDKARDKASKDKDSSKGDSYDSVKQIVLVMNDEDHETATKGLDRVMKDESCENYTDAFLRLLTFYENVQEKLKAQRLKKSVKLK